MDTLASEGEGQRALVSGGLSPHSRPGPRVVSPAAASQNPAHAPGSPSRPIGTGHLVESQQGQRGCLLGLRVLTPDTPEETVSGGAVTIT